jgi:hypothetical protein
MAGSRSRRRRDLARRIRNRELRAEVDRHQQLYRMSSRAIRLGLASRWMSADERCKYELRLRGYGAIPPLGIVLPFHKSVPNMGS